MRISSINNRYHLVDGDVALDIEHASNGRFAATGFDLYERWNELTDWSTTVSADSYRSFDRAALGAPVAMPRQVFAIGLNYRDHAAEAGLDEPDAPLVFTKFPTCITGPSTPISLPSDNVDWEVELVAVIGKKADHISEDRGWDHIAGLTVGQDISERAIQLSGPAPQFGLGKSFPGFGPIGPAVVSVDELTNVDDLEIGCSLDDEVLQKGRTSDLIFSIPELVARISAICPLLPGDIIFTGTPAGVGAARNPKRFLPRGGTLVSYIQDIGELRNPLI